MHKCQTENAKHQHTGAQNKYSIFPGIKKRERERVKELLDFLYAPESIVKRSHFCL